MVGVSGRTWPVRLAVFARPTAFELAGPTSLPSPRTESADTSPVTDPVSPMIKLRLRTLPCTAPSSWISPSLTTSPLIRRSDEIVDIALFPPADATGAVDDAETHRVEPSHFDP